jgi:anaerobic magnesium-protoporphyrin IX monomethyl ester cyclase
MKILLSVPVRSLISDPPGFADLGLGYLAAHLETQGHEVAIHDWTRHLSPSAYKEFVRRWAPDAVGLKVFTFNIPGVLKTLELIRQAAPRARIILGGPHPSATDPEEIFADFPGIDYAIQGEAETALPRLIAHLQGAPMDLDTIPGLVRREGDAVRVNSKVYEEDLDRLGLPAWDKLDPQRYSSQGLLPRSKGATAVLSVTRGCPGGCGFCSIHQISGKKVRTRSPEQVLAEIEYLVEKFQIRQLIFTDTNFLYHRDHAAAICEGLLQWGIKVTWDCVSDVSWYNCDPALYRLMVRSGCVMMQVGIESGSDRVRRLMGQVESVREVRNQVELLHRSGIQVGGWFLIGFPDESRLEIDQTIDLAFSLPLVQAFVGLCYPLPGTRAYAWLKERHGIARLQWASFDLKRSPYPMSRLSSAELTAIWKRVQRHLFRRNVLRRVNSWIPDPVKRWSRAMVGGF